MFLVPRRSRISKDVMCIGENYENKPESENLRGIDEVVRVKETKPKRFHLASD